MAGGRVYAAGNSNRTDTVYCFDAPSGRVLWTHSRPCDPQPLSYEGGPSATPLVEGARLYTFGKDGALFCYDALTGAVVWSRTFAAWPRLEGDWANTWRYAGSPWISGNRLFMALGQAGACLNPADGAHPLAKHQRPSRILLPRSVCRRRHPRHGLLRGPRA